MAGAGRAGAVALRPGRRALVGGQISSGTAGPGNAGLVSVTVAGALTIDGSNAPFATGIASQANQGSTGQGGMIVVQAGSLTMSNAGFISSSTAGSGNAGTI